jgi:lipopolysaccharide export system permease protein
MFVVMFVVIDALNSLDDFLSNDVALTVIGIYYFSMIPMVLSYAMPAAVLMAVLYALGALSKSNEISAMRAGGVSGFHILLPVLFLGLVLSVGLFAVNETVTPKSANLSLSIRDGAIKNRGGDSSNRSIENVASVTSGNRMLYARELIPSTKSLYDIVILEHSDSLQLKRKLTAKRGVYSDKIWTLYDIVEYSLDSQGDIIDKPLNFKSKIININETPNDFVKQHTQPEFMSSKQLKDYMKNTTLTGYRISNRLLMDYHKKFAQPLMCFIMLLVAAPLSLRYKREGTMISLGMGVMIIAIYYFLVAVSTALGKGGVLPPPAAAWLPNLTYFFVGIYLLRKNV